MLFSLIKKSFFVLSLSALACFEVSANDPIEQIAFPNVFADDPIETLPPTGNQFKFQPEKTKTPGKWNATLVGCSPEELIDAINYGNTAGSAIFQLSSNCTYTILDPATVNEAFPIITGDITILGGTGTVISRDPTALAFRIFTVDTGAALALRYLTIENGNTAGLGGGILNNGSLIVDNVTLIHNNASSGGAISVSSGATAQVLQSILDNNTTTGVGGGAILNSGELYVRNSNLTGNTAPINGGAINTQASGVTTLMLNLITYNTSGGLGGGLSNLGTTNVFQSIVNYNTGSSGGGIATGNANVTISKTSNTAIINNVPDNCSPLNTIEGCVG